MRFPLILASKPIVGSLFPSVKVEAGSWIITSNLLDTQLELYIDESPVPLEPNMKLSFKDVTKLRANVVKAGSEPFLSVFAERLV